MGAWVSSCDHGIDALLGIQPTTYAGWINFANGFVLFKAPGCLLKPHQERSVVLVIIPIQSLMKHPKYNVSITSVTKP